MTRRRRIKPQEDGRRRIQSSLLNNSNRPSNVASLTTASRALSTARNPRRARVVPAPKGQEIIRDARSKELFFGVVGPVGAGGSRVIESLRRACKTAGYTCEFIKASDLIKSWAISEGKEVPPASPKTLSTVQKFQDLGDEMRSKDASAVARASLMEIAKRRASATSQKFTAGIAVQPDDSKRAYLIESIRHPAEVHLLRRIYSTSFALIGVVCEESEREKRILGKYFTDPDRRKEDNKTAVRQFMRRDADDSVKSHGQHVTDAFFEADFFVDNTKSDQNDDLQLLDDNMGRLVSIISHDRVIRPTIEETSMHHAYSARMRSSCLSRQVGAALVDCGGTIVATGTNEVPRAGGGVYGEGFASNSVASDDRCAFRETQYCSNNKEQNKIIDELILAIPELTDVEDKSGLARRIRTTRVGQLLEFSRAVHAEMDALLSAGREGVSTVGTRLFVTTFPCHYCARHIVSAGVVEVQYIEPFPKSMALNLHRDSIEVDFSSWNNSPLVPDTESEGYRKVLFRPFVGVAPRLYARAFEKKWSLKNKFTGDFEMKAPEWGDEWSSFTMGYPQLEAALGPNQ